MKSVLKKYPSLFRLALVLFVAAILGSIGLVHSAIALVCVFQLCELAKAPRVAVCFTVGLTPAQQREFEDILAKMGDKWEDVMTMMKDFGSLRKEVDELRGDAKKLRRTMIAGGGIGNSGVRWIGNVPFVTDECAAALTSVFVLDCARIDNALERMVPDDTRRKMLIARAANTLGIEQRAALTTTEIPVPTIFAPQIVELVFAFGAARQYATVFPLGSGQVKLPRLKAGEDDFAYLGAGTAGMSQAVPEKKVATEMVTFNANKFGGMIRIPTELEEDTFIPIGQFLARYIARQLAKGEDKTVFLADGTATYASQTGVGPYCVATPAYLRVLGAGKTKVTDSTINDFRAMRGLVNPAVLANMAANGQTSAAYYLHPSLESLLVTFNTIGTPQIYIPQSAGKSASLDGFPIRWIGVSAANTGLANPTAFIAFFGDLSFIYLGERGSVRVEVSKEVFFSTDELAMRALERIDVEITAIDAMSTLQTAAA